MIVCTAAIVITYFSNFDDNPDEPDAHLRYQTIFWIIGSGFVYEDGELDACFKYWYIAILNIFSIFSLISFIYIPFLELIIVKLITH